MSIHFNQRLFAALILLLFVASSCRKEKQFNQEAEEDQLSVFRGNGFRKEGFRYIAVGNSITAGYSSGGLYREGQEVAYPNILAEQLRFYGFGSFSSPLFPVDQKNGSGYLRLAGFNADGSPNIVPVTDQLAIRDSADIPGYGPVTLYTKYTGRIDNYGVPGIKLKYVTEPLYGNLNGYFERLLPGVAGTNTTTYLDFVTANHFDFFSCWLGNNDALGYATSGGDQDVLTEKSQFLQLYQKTILELTKHASLGVVATIPNLISLPYFTTITVKQLIQGATKVNPAFNTLYIKALNPSTGAYITRPATDNDLIVLSFNTSQLGTVVNGLPGYGLIPQNPLLSKEVLDAAEVAKVQDYIGYYNYIIKLAAAYKHLALFDAYDFLTRLRSGMVVNGIYIDSKFITGGVFSLDGVHLTPRGNALAADQFIKAINEKYHSKIPLVDISTYKGVL